MSLSYVVLEMFNEVMLKSVCPRLNPKKGVLYLTCKVNVQS